MYLGARWRAGSRLAAFRWLIAPQRGHLMLSSMYRPEASLRWHWPQRISSASAAKCGVDAR
ncbi:hypothetical protein WM34_29660 [Burkholderia ubonensis]|nr:hypothetical protein WL67_21355 [Burkholderia ubonensis]KWD60560.1 hypothetical protein WL66_05940 [Burkholderia ubonensis]KWQ01083.1 hypothetical protein WM34_29660 [Burkholderia ubonensis]